MIGIYATKDRLHPCLPTGRHQNPVRAGLVYRTEYYVYSSASNYAGIDQIIDVDCLFYAL